MALGNWSTKVNNFAIETIQPKKVFQKLLQAKICAFQDLSINKYIASNLRQVAIRNNQLRGRQLYAIRHYDERKHMTK